MKLDLGNKTITIRKWKGKDKKNFINDFKEEKDQNAFIDHLIYSCIDEDVVLSQDELKYVLSRIRAISIGDDFDMDFYCEECGEIHNQTFKITDVIDFEVSKENLIKSGPVKIRLQEVRNKEYYQKAIQEDDLYDFLLRIKSFNNNDGLTLEELEAELENLDVDVLDDVMEQWENIRFKIKDINKVTCPSCNHEELYEFDEIPGFIPDSWFGA